MRVILLFMLSLLAMWASAQHFNDPTKPPIQYSVFREGTNGKLKTFRTYRIKTNADWQRTWTEVTGEPANLAPRGVDWMKDELWVICLGERPTGGYSLRFLGAEYLDTNIIEAKYGEVAPLRGEFVTQAITSPYIVVRVNKTAGNPKFTRCNVGEGYDGGTVIIGPGYTYGPDTRPIRWNQVDKGANCNYRESRSFVLTTESEFIEYWKAVHPSRELTNALLRSIGWSDEIVIALHAGQTNQPGARVEIDRVLLDSSGKLSISWYVDYEQGIGSNRYSSPYLLLRLPRYTTNPQIRKLPGRPWN